MVFAKANTAPRRRQVQLLVHGLQLINPPSELACVQVEPREAKRMNAASVARGGGALAGSFLLAVGRRLFGSAPSSVGPAADELS